MSLVSIHSPRHNPRSAYVFRLRTWTCMLAALGLSVLLAWAWSSLTMSIRWPYLDIRKFELSGSFVNSSGERLKQLLHQASAGENYFSLDLDKLRKQLEALPWVKEARLKRVWPGAVSITVDEHQALASYGDSALLSDEGVIFYPDMKTVEKPRLSITASPESLPQLIRTINHFNVWTEGADLRLIALDEIHRQILHLHLSNGWTLVLGRLNREKNIKRFLKVYPRLADSYLIEQIDYLDLRYPDGFAISCREKQPCKL